MQVSAESSCCFAVFDLGGGEVVLILALILIMLAAKRLPDLGRGLRQGRDEFRKSIGEVRDEIDGAASEAGKSVGGIYGKPAFEALTPKNQTAELYDPSAVQRNDGPERSRWFDRWFRKIWLWGKRFFRHRTGSH